ncbi:uncharacterized protein LOC134314688 [Trichomycterus rosablanca]|uniref:uncharacterized protein LOC134314688 n=1 Tax=Trichomycterus rosablanca TaxID=2290929 RepID=UPI002F35EF21
MVPLQLVGASEHFSVGVWTWSRAAGTISRLLWFWSRFRRSRRPDANPDDPEEEAENVRNDEAERANTRSKRGKKWRRIFRRKNRETGMEVEEEAGESSAEQGPAGVEHHRDATELLPAPAENAERPAGGEEAIDSVPDGGDEMVDQRQDNEILMETESEDVKELANFLLDETEAESERITELTENTLDDLEASCSELEDKILKLLEEAEAAEARMEELKREEAEAFAREDYGGMLVMSEGVEDIYEIMVSAGDTRLSSDERSRIRVTPFWYESGLLFPRHARRRDGI